MSQPTTAVPAGAVVVGYDSTEISERAVRWAALVARHLGRPLHVLSARDSEGATRRSPEGIDIARQVDDTLAVTGSDPEGPAPARLARAGDQATMVVTGRRARGRLKSSLLGTASVSTAQHTTCPVVIVHADDPADRLPARIVVGADGSPESTAALDFALALVTDGGAITLLLVWSPLPADSTVPIPEVAHAMLRDTLAGRSREGVTIDLVARPGNPREVLLATGADADLLVVGRGSRPGRLGSVATHAVYEARCPVATVTGPVATRGRKEKEADQSRA